MHRTDQRVHSRINAAIPLDVWIRVEVSSDAERRLSRSGGYPRAWIKMIEQVAKEVECLTGLAVTVPSAPVGNPLKVR